MTTSQPDFDIPSWYDHPHMLTSLSPGLLPLFAPLTLFNFGLFGLILFCFEIVGARLAAELKFPAYLRLMAWVWGAMAFVFGWFGLHFFWPFSPWLTWGTLLTITLPHVYWYFKSKQLPKLILALAKYPWVLVFSLLVAKPLFFAVSTPPHIWDEMAYHYYSPAQVQFEQSWQFTSDMTGDFSLYAMLPRFLDTSFVLLFSLTNTYAAARLFHLLLFLTTLSVVGMYLQTRFSGTVGWCWAFLSLFLHPPILLAATTGYVDAASASTILVLTVTIHDWLVQSSWPKWWAITLLSGLALSSKYTTTVFVFGIGLILIGTLLFRTFTNIFQLRSLSSKLLLRWMIKTGVFLLLAIGGGGYWYLKNLWLTHNPIFPFLFPCKAGVLCNTSSFFSGWALPISWENWPLIKEQLFTPHFNLLGLLQLGLIVTTLTSIIRRDWSRLSLMLLLGLSLSFEVAIHHLFSGYVDRYFYHWFLFVALGLALPLSDFRMTNVSGLALKTVILIWVASYVVMLWKRPVAIARVNVTNANNPQAIETTHRAYVRHQMSLTAWQQHHFPELSSVLEWCAQQPDSPTLYVLDPLLIWRSYEGLFRVYVQNCQLQRVAASTEAIQLVQTLQANTSAYVVSLDTCHDEPNPYADPGLELESAFYQLNQELICQANQPAPHLYQLSQ